MGKKDRMHDEMDNFSRHEAKNPIEMVELNTTIKETKNDFDGLFSKLCVVEERIVNIKTGQQN